MPPTVRLALLIALLGASAGAVAAELRLRALLAAHEVAPATKSAATGEARVLLTGDNAVHIDLVCSQLDERATGAALHVGRAGENGPEVGRIELGIDGDEGRAIGATLAVAPGIAERMRAGDSYLVILTREHPAGVIRGQLRPHPLRVADLPAAGD